MQQNVSLFYLDLATVGSDSSVATVGSDSSVVTATFSVIMCGYKCVKVQLCNHLHVSQQQQLCLQQQLSKAARPQQQMLACLTAEPSMTAAVALYF